MLHFASGEGYSVKSINLYSTENGPDNSPSCAGNTSGGVGLAQQLFSTQ